MFRTPKTLSAIAALVVAAPMAMAQAPAQPAPAATAIAATVAAVVEPAKDAATIAPAPTTEQGTATAAPLADSSKVDGSKPETAVAVAPASSLAPPVAAAPVVAPADPVMMAVRSKSAADRALADYYGAASKPLFTGADGLSAKGVAMIAEFAKAADYGLSPAAYRVGDVTGAFTSPDQQAAHEIAVAKAVLLYASHARGGRIPDPSRISSNMDMNPTLADSKVVLETVASAADGGAALRGFQPQHAGFVNLVKALAVVRAGKPAPETEQRILVNLERWRWMPQSLGAFHVWNNIPEQVTRVVKAGDVVFTERIVVGKPGHATPLMSADMLYVIFHPSWGVPDGIKSNEVAPMLRRASASSNSFFDLFDGGGGNGRASAALARHELRVSMNGRPINPDAVDWRKVDIRQFHFTQPPSRKNVLGVVKFRFPNKYDVYMHDTPERNLFASNVRAFSHGCMRVQDPLKLAAVLLGHDKGWSEDKVRSFVPGGRTSDITLTTPIPVHLTYFTASADAVGKLTLHGDIYGSDSRVASAIVGKPVALAAAKVVSDGPSSRRPRRAAAASKRDTVSERPWNPFALSSN